MRSSISSINFDQHEYDNPIYRAQRDFHFKETVTEEKDKYIIEQLEDLKNTQQHLLGILNSFNTFERPVLRLIKASKNFNVSINNIADYLEQNDIIIERNPNYKISPKTYKIIKAEFDKK